MSTFIKVEISAETKQQADDILNVLLENKLVAGSILTNAPSRFWWKGQVLDMEYFTLSAFSLSQHQEAIIEQVKALTTEEVPMVWFWEINGNIELLDWITASCAS